MHHAATDTRQLQNQSLFSDFNSDPIRIEQVAYDPGLIGLWHAAVRFLDLVEPPGADVPP